MPADVPDTPGHRDFTAFPAVRARGRGDPAFGSAGIAGRGAAAYEPVGHTG